jgi:amino acid transporter
MASISWQSIIAVDCYIISDIIQALLVVNNPNYNPTRWAGTLFTILTVIFVVAFNTFGATHLPFAEGIFATCRVFAFAPLIVTLWVMVTPKLDPAEVFVNFRDHTGTWPSTGLSALVGQISCMFVTLGSDAVAHLAEEVEDAAIVVPQGMMWSYILVSKTVLMPQL